MIVYEFSSFKSIIFFWHITYIKNESSHGKKTIDLNFEIHIQICVNDENDVKNIKD